MVYFEDSPNFCVSDGISRITEGNGVFLYTKFMSDTATAVLITHSACEE